MCIAIVGGLIGGYKVYGPFNNIDQAVTWAEDRQPLIGHVTIMNVIDSNEIPSCHEYQEDEK
jgi:hypothetical protein